MALATSRINYAGPGIGQKRGSTRALWIVLAIVALALAFALATPLLNHRDPSSPRLRCVSNLRQIGQGIAMYANENGGHFPDDLKMLFESEDLGTNVFVCPASHETPAAQGPTTRATANTLAQPGHISYIYIGRGFHAADVPTDAVIAYEPLSNHGADGMNVLFGDFHVEWLSAAEAATILKQVAAKRSPVRYPFTQPAATSKSG